MNNMITALPRPFSLLLYIAIVFGLSWPFMFIPFFREGFVWRLASHCTAMMMVTVGTVICARYVFKDGFGDAGWSWGRPVHHLTAFAIPAANWLLPAAIDLATGSGSVGQPMTDLRFMFAMGLLVIPLIPAFGEELGWRGYMLPHIARRMSTRKAVVLHGIIWFVWHWPVMISAAGAVTQASGFGIYTSILLIIGVGSIPIILDSVVFAYVWMWSRSIWTVTLLHAAHDGFRDSLMMLIDSGSFSEIAIVVPVVLGAFLLWKGDWSELKKASRA